MSANAQPAPLLEVRGISKRYGNSWALQPLDLSITEGSVHGLLGKNGAGKSTLMGIIAGSTTPTAGKVLFRGEDITSTTLAQRRKLGIRLLPQHAEILPNLSVTENLLSPDYPGRGLIDWNECKRAAHELLDQYGLSIPVDAKAGALALPEQRKLGIVKTLADNGQLAMLDEPTTALSRSERSSLFDWMRELNAKGQTFVYISHFNNEIQEVCDEYTVLRDAQLVGAGPRVRDLSSADLSELVTGEGVEEFHRRPQTGRPTALRVVELSAPGVDNVSLEVGKGEVVGLVGLPGSGAQETARALAGLNPPTAGQVSLDGERISCRAVSSAVRSGVVYLTADRHGEGIVGPMSVQESLHVGAWPTRHGLLSNNVMRSTFNTYRTKLSLRVQGPHQRVSELSGGNQQKILIGRLLALSPHLLILDEPTLGIDVGTKEEVHRLVDELTRDGMSVILLAYDTDELVRVVDRAIAFQDGAVAQELSGADLTADNILDALTHKTTTYSGSTT